MPRYVRQCKEHIRHVKQRRSMRCSNIANEVKIAKQLRTYGAVARAMGVLMHSKTQPGEILNLFVTLTVRTSVWIVLNWTFQQSMAIGTERQVQRIAYRGKLWVSPTYEPVQTRNSVLLAIICCKVQFGTIHAKVRTVSVAKILWLSPGGVSLCYPVTVPRRKA